MHKAGLVCYLSAAACVALCLACILTEGQDRAATTKSTDPPLSVMGRHK